MAPTRIALSLECAGSRSPLARRQPIPIAKEESSWLSQRQHGFFISYSHDSPEHEDHVLDLADRLRLDGIDVNIDQYEPAPPESWPAWCEAEIREARFVLMVCTKTYLRRVDGKEEPGKGYGVLWEGHLIKQLLYRAGSVSDKIVPVLLSDGSDADVPLPVAGWTIYRAETPQGYENLYRLLTNQPRVRKPELGKLRRLPERRRQWAGGPPPEVERTGAAQINLSSIPTQDRAIAQKILDAFAAAGFGVIQQVAALANAIRESNLKPNAHSTPPEDSVGFIPAQSGRWCRQSTQYSIAARSGHQHQPRSPRGHRVS
jgi:hypothetical protein